MDADAQLKATLKEHGHEFCTCGRELDRGDISWNNGETEYGTPWAYSQIICLNCDEEIAQWSSWSNADSFEEWVNQILPDWTIE